MKKNILKDILNVFEKHQAYDNQKLVNPADFKDLKYSTTNIVRMLGNLVENKIVICNDNRQMYMRMDKWEQYCSKAKSKVIFVYIFCGLLSLLAFLLVV